MHAPIVRRMHPNACFWSVHLAIESCGLHMLYIYAPHSSAFAERIRGAKHPVTTAICDIG